MTQGSNHVQARLQNGEVAQRILFRFNLRLVSSIAKNFEGKGLDPSDLIVDGASGLERAIQLYDPSKGHKFSTYAYNWIRQAMGISIVENARVVRLPSHVVEASFFAFPNKQTLLNRQTRGNPPSNAYLLLRRKHASLYTYSL